MTDINSLISLPEYLQVVVVSGYIGYSIAYAGFRDNEKTDDKFYRILAFGLFGYFTYDLIKGLGGNIIWSGLGAIVTTMILAALWRKFGKKGMTEALHKAGISNEDGINDVWTRISQDTEIFPSMVVVRLKDGSIVECDDVQSFKDAPIPLYYTDNYGNFALYITRRTLADGVVKEYPDLRNEAWGDRITYLPKSEISQISVRFMKKV